MTNTLHIYGDSFSAGYGLTPRISNIPPGYAQYESFTWNKNITNFIPNIEVKNNAIPGSSNEIIQSIFLKDLNTFKSGDIVVIGLSDYSRISTILNYQNGKVTDYLHLTGRAYMLHAQNLLSKTPIKNFIPHYLKEVFGKNNLPASMFTNGMEFLHDFYLNDKIRDSKRDYFKDCYLSLVEFLSKQGISLYVWDSTIWGDGENIITWSSNTYKYINYIATNKCSTYLFNSFSFI